MGVIVISLRTPQSAGENFGSDGDKPGFADDKSACADDKSGSANKRESADDNPGNTSTHCKAVWDK